MAKKKLDTAINKEKLDLGQTLYALDMRNKAYYNNLSDEMKKKYAPPVLMRFMSSAANQGGLHEAHLTIVNDIVNQNFWSFSKNHKEFQHILLATCGLGKKQYHGWIPMPKGSNTDKLSIFIKQIYPDMNSTEFDLFISLNDSEDMRELAKSYALDDKETDDLVEQFEKVKHGKK